LIILIITILTQQRYKKKLVSNILFTKVINNWSVNSVFTR